MLEVYNEFQNLTPKKEIENCPWVDLHLGKYNIDWLSLMNSLHKDAAKSGNNQREYVVLSLLHKIIHKLLLFNNNVLILPRYV